MALPLVAAAILVVVVGLAMLAGSGRGLLVGIGVLALAVAGGAAFLLLSPKAPPPPAPPVKPPAAAPAPPPPAPEAPAGWTVKGRVLRGCEGETPAPGAVLEAFEGEGGPVAFAAASVRAVAGEDGRFELAGIRWPEARIRASAPGFVPIVFPTTKDHEGEMILRLVPGSFAAGRVLDQETKGPVAGARVSSGDAAGTTTAEDGSFRLEGVPLGKTRLEVSAAGYVRERKRVTVPEKGVEDVEIHLAPGASVAGTVRDAQGRPVEGASIAVEADFKAPFVGGVPVPVEVDPIRSGKDGTYRADGLPAGRKVHLGASHETGYSDPVEAGPVEKGRTQEGVDIVLQPSATVVATVLDGKGAPLAGARVSVTPAEGKERGFAVMIREQIEDAVGGGKDATDEKGLRRVRGVRPGPVKVRASKEDYRAAEQTAVANAGSDLLLTLVLDAGEAIRGRVEDPAGAPVAGAEVTVTAFGMGTMTRESRTTKEDGTFLVGGLVKKAHMVRASKQGFVGKGLNGIEPGGADLVLVLEPGGTVVGRVIDAAGKPVAKFRANATKEGDSGGFDMANPERMFTGMAGEEHRDPDGRFRIEGLEPGKYRVEARAEGLAPGRAEGIAVASGRETEANLVLGEGLTLRGIVVRRTDGAPVAGAAVTIPPPGIFGEMDFNLDLGDVDELSGDVEVSQQIASIFGGQGGVTTGADGRFTLTGLEAGSLNLRVKAKGLAPAKVQAVEIPAPQELRVELGEEAALEGTVTDAKGTPKEGVMVMLNRGMFPAGMANTDAQGHYRIAGIAAGTYLFLVMDQSRLMTGGMNMRMVPVTLEEGKVTRRDHRMDEGTKVVGRVTRGGKPVEQAMVMLSPASAGGGGPFGGLFGGGGGGGGGFAMDTTGEDGTYEIAGVGPGRYTVTVQGGGGGLSGGGEPLEVPRGATEVRRDIVLPDAAIEGQVVDDAGEPVAGAILTASEAGKDVTRASDFGAILEATAGQAFSDDVGHFSMSGMKPGTYSLRVQKGGYGTETLDGVAATEGGSAVKVVLRRGSEVTVRVTGPDGSPVRGASVFLSDSESRELTTLDAFEPVRTGADGRAVVRAQAGTLRFEATAPGFAPGETTAQVPGGEVSIRLARGATLKVMVTGADRSPLAGAVVEILDPAGKPYAPRFSLESFPELLQGGTTGSDGVRLWKDLPAGSWKVRAHGGEGRVAEQDVTVAEGETKEVAIRLP